MNKNKKKLTKNNNKKIWVNADGVKLDYFILISGS